MSGGVVVLGLLIAGMVGQVIAAEDVRPLIYAALGLAVCVVSLAIVKDWRAGFYVFIIWLLLEDLFRKYMGNNMVIYFAKDALVTVIYFSFFFPFGKRRRAPLHTASLF
jgi:hypothetical protein